MKRLDMDITKVMIIVAIAIVVMTVVGIAIAVHTGNTDFNTVEWVANPANPIWLQLH